MGELAAFGDAQTAQLDIANSRTRDAIAICKAYNAQLAAATKELQPKPWWHLGIW